MPKNTPRDADQPRLGAFITMLVGIVLFFGMVSRIHDFPGTVRVEVPVEDEDEALRQELAEERQRALAIFGRRDPAREFEHINRAIGALPGMDTPSGVEADDTDEADGPESDPNPPQRPTPPAPPTRPSPPTPPERAYHVVKPGETLWGIAQTAYGDGNHYRLIEDANPGVRAAIIKPGDRLLVPALSGTAHSGGNALTP